MKDIQTICRHFPFDGRLIYSEPYGCGHINDTYCLYFDRENFPPCRVILQRINTDIFRDPKGLMNNISLVTAHIRRKLTEGGGDAERGTLSVLPASDGKLFYEAEDGNCYRAYKFVECSFSLQSVENASQFAGLGETFGNFQNILSDFDASTLVETIPDFHNTEKRFEALESAIYANTVGRADEVKSEIAFALARKEDASVLVEMLNRGELPLRVTHNDTKLNNVLFDADSGKALCVIDLDTVMPGLVHYDFGDSIRFGASTAAEDEKDLSKVTMSLELFKAYATGFLRACGDKLTDKEIEMLPFSAKLMTFECGIRFLADYLSGDTYFKTHYEGQNLDRCRTQFKLVADMESKMDQMQSIIRGLTAK